MKNNSAFKLRYLWILCLGVVLFGLGIGIQLAEISAMSYGGRELIENTQREEKLVIAIPDKAEQVTLNSYGVELASELGRMETSGSVEPGTVELDIKYAGVEMDFSYFVDYVDESEKQQYINLYYNTAEGELAAVFSCKDAILEDIRQGKICEYDIWRVSEIVLTVNPLDKDRVSIG